MESREEDYGVINIINIKIISSIVFHITVFDIESQDQDYEVKIFLTIASDQRPGNIWIEIISGENRSPLALGGVHQALGWQVTWRKNIFPG